MDRFAENRPNGRLYLFMAPHPAFADMNEDHQLAELARHEPSDREAAARMRRDARAGRPGIAHAIAGILRQMLIASRKPRQMP
ncbi:MAG: hypothetical protein DI533_12295 [Cereibacter sphaeroides]|uniref:Uncharacterized protein n=1 Tax=Cereibacter sphaeroides TaxID=1063 RepID=A0A2W5SF81_CERSP|nr:MAG: hypothetical protein DI533_12295 [Cereibacter sphaeroides]